MKKTLIALAALAAFGSASAQMAATTITPYARIDIGLGKSTSNAPGAIDPGLTVQNAIYEGSHFGVKSEVDIGGGLKGYAQLEEGFNSQDQNVGFTGGNVTNRVALIGIGGSFGRFDIGTAWGPYDNVAQDPTNYNGFSSYGVVLNGGAHGDNGNSPAGAGSTVGSIQYTTPTVGGLTGTISYAPKKDGTAANNDLSTTAFDVTYVAGPLNIAAAYERVPTIYTNDTAFAGANGYANAWHISGLYDLKSVVLGLALTGASVNGVAATAGGSGTDTDTGYNIAASFPLGQWTPSLGYGSVKTSGDNLNQTSSSLGAQALYSFSKVFGAYVGWRQTKTTYNAGGDKTVTKYGAGLTADF